MAVTDVSASVIATAVFFSGLRVIKWFNDVIRADLDEWFAAGRVEDLATFCRLIQAQFLLDQSENQSQTPGHHLNLIANHLATTPESHQPFPSYLGKAGAIHFDRHRIIVIQPDILRPQAQLY